MELFVTRLLRVSSVGGITALAAINTRLKKEKWTGAPGKFVFLL